MDLELDIEHHKNKQTNKQTKNPKNYLSLKLQLSALQWELRLWPRIFNNHRICISKSIETLDRIIQTSSGSFFYTLYLSTYVFTFIFIFLLDGFDFFCCFENILDKLFNLHRFLTTIFTLHIIPLQSFLLFQQNSIPIFHVYQFGFPFFWLMSALVAV